MMKTIFHNSQKRGSALLIVLGFLSFLIISSVSFAIYMRLERQASSNYRHAVMARHLLNSALYRAMDEIDSELRICTTTNDITQAPKFPDWPGRTRPSAVPNGQDNGEEARVLSMEALSYIPAIFVNDVRRYAVTNQYDRVNGVNGANEKYSYLGAKWRPLSMPVTSLAGLGRDVNAYEEAVIGRYAYLCVNLSDMLDVNVCRAVVRNAETNRVSIGHLFATDGARTTFDTNFKTKDYAYQTLQDFYACMYAHGDTTFGSPLHKWMTDSSVSLTAFDTAANHILVAGGMAKSEPKNSTETPINIADQSFKGEANVAGTAEKFASYLVKAGGTSDPFPSDAQEELQGMLIDYLDEDSTPYNGHSFNGLYRPTTEMVPMIYQFIILDPTQNFLKPMIISEETGVDPDKKTTYSLKLTEENSQVSVMIETLFPFKQWKDRLVTSESRKFTLEVEAYLFASIPDNGSTWLSTRNTDLRSLLTPVSGFRLNPAGGSSPDIELNSDDVQPSPAVRKFTTPPCVVKLYTKKESDGTIDWALPKDAKVKLALVVFASIKNNDGNYVDMVPGYFQPTETPDPTFQTAVTQNRNYDRLFFETITPIVMKDPLDALNGPLPLKWTSLVVPDPRYNHKASNWVWGTKTAQDPGVSEVTEQLLGKKGRDGDVYQFVSNQGRLYSPGEFGFLPRPFANAVAQSPGKELNSNATADDTEDTEAMFRTIRLYDHYDTANSRNYLQDNVYDYFTAENADGTAIGARVNPLSKISRVLYAAIEQMPVDYWYAAQTGLTDTQVKESRFNFILGDVWNLDLNGNTSPWGVFRKQWYLGVSNAVESAGVNTSWRKKLTDYYGSRAYFKWYSESTDQKTILGVNIGKELDEIDRKMLYSFSLDSFSDCQQLFLYILRAEATVPSLGGKTKSLAGGRAVALVWRDPYPVGYSYNKTTSVETWQNKGSKTWYQQNLDKTFKRISPWYQVNKNQYDDTHEAYDQDPTANFTRRDGYHEQKILFFKRLEE